MKDLGKVNAGQLFAFWKNLTLSLMVLMATLLLSRLLPSYFSPIIGLIAAAFLYTVLYNNRLRSNSSCPIVIYAIFFCIVAYSFVSIIINVLDIWSVVPIPKELSFFNEPYMCSLVLDPVTVIVLGIINLRGNKLSICVDCRITKGMAMERGKLGEILAIETRLQLRNLFWLFLIFSIAVWTYFFVWYYQNALVNNRDWYIFVWINIIGIALDLAYFASRYYNIYLDLQDSGEIITEAELSDMTTKTYLRFYAICGNKIFINPKVADPRRQGMFVIDTPLLTKRNVNGITTSEVHSIIKRMTGVDAKLRFFFGRKSLDIAKHRILRYFYFMDEVDGQPPKLDIDGEWVDFNVIKTIYNTKPAALSNTFLTDLSRMVTIILTQKLFDERGYRKMKVKSYVPTIDLKEIQEKDYDFQDDKWIRVAMYNSDQRGFYFKKWVNRFFGKEDKNKEGQIQRRR